MINNNFKNNMFCVLKSAILFIGFTSAASAVTFNVDSSADAIDAALSEPACSSVIFTGTTPPARSCTLRAAIMQANATLGPDTIILPAGNYTLSLRRVSSANTFGLTENNTAAGDLDITDSLHIIAGDPSNPDDTTIKFRNTNNLADRDRIFQVTPKSETIDVLIQGLTIQGGYQSNENQGGGGLLVYKGSGFLDNSPNVTLQNVNFIGNFSGVTGGAVANWGGNVLIEDSIIDGNRTPYIVNNTRNFQNTGRTATFEGGGQGGGIANWSGEMTLRRTEITDNLAQNGGGVYSQDASNIISMVLIEDSMISDNKSFMGAGLFTVANGNWDFAARKLVKHGLILNRTTVSDNVSEFAGGGLYTMGLGSTLISTSTFSGNEAWDSPGHPSYPGRGGGIYHSSRVMDIVSSTIAGNDAQEARVTDVLTTSSNGGDEIFVDFANGTSRPGSSASRFTIQNSIIGDGPPTDSSDPGFGVDDNCNGPEGYQDSIQSLGGNLDSGTTCFANSATSPSNKVSKSLNGGNAINPVMLGLAELTDNSGLHKLPSGGYVQTRALKPGSVAIRAGEGCPGSDQRGFAVTGTCDIGAYQVNVDITQAGNAAPIPQVDEISVTAGSSAPVVVPVLQNDRDPDITDELNIVSIVDPAVGSAVLNSDTNTISVTIPSNVESGAPAEIVVLYTVSDGDKVAEGKLVVVAYAENDNTLPQAANDALSISSEDKKMVIYLLTNDSDADKGDVLRINTVEIIDANVGTLHYNNDNANDNNENASSTTTTIDDDSTVTNTITITNENGDDVGIGIIEEGTVVYVPGPNFTGEFQFSYTIADNRGGVSEPAVVTVNVNGAPKITKINQVLSLNAERKVSGVITAIDPEGDSISFSGGIGLQGQAVFTDDNGAFEYTANEGAEGLDSFTIAVSDGIGMGATTVQVEISKTVAPAPSDSRQEPQTENPSLSSGTIVIETSSSTGGDEGGGGALNFVVLLLGLLLVPLLRRRNYLRS
ncbi:hypothetical protein MNBD_GAMMA16-355 [hydrothermal vent metagenome]|uniref:RapA2 cadherin-like domain-containing protein n=1 Tax=hydrothermal vent metagenome TaxID=652676 RepID=A0A3B0YVH2_9ZZZZ